jgi:hypothetical protein
MIHTDGKRTVADNTGRTDADRFPLDPQTRTAKHGDALFPRSSWARTADDIRNLPEVDRRA